MSCWARKGAGGKQHPARRGSITETSWCEDARQIIDDPQGVTLFFSSPSSVELTDTVGTLYSLPRRQLDRFHPTTLSEWAALGESSKEKGR